MSAYREAVDVDSTKPVVYRPRRPMVIAMLILFGTLPLLVFIGWKTAQMHHVQLHCEHASASSGCVVTEDYLVTTRERRLSFGDIRGTTVTVHKPLLFELEGYEYSVALLVGGETIAVGPRTTFRLLADQLAAALKVNLAATAAAPTVDLDRGRDRSFVVAFVLVALGVLALGVAYELQHFEVRLDQRRELLRIVHRRWPLAAHVDEVPISEVTAFHIVERRGGLVNGRFVVLERKTGPDIELFAKTGMASRAYNEEIVRALEALRARGGSGVV